MTKSQKMSEQDMQSSGGSGWEVGAALDFHIVDEGWAGLGETEESESTKVDKGCHREVTEQEDGREGAVGDEEGEVCSCLTYVIRLSRAGKKTAGSFLMVAEDEKTRRSNKKPYVAPTPWLIGCVPWILPIRCCQIGKHAGSTIATIGKNNARFYRKKAYRLFF